MLLVQDTYPQQAEQDDFCFYSRPNCSLTQGQRKTVFCGIAAVTLAIAATFGWLGYWLVLPFAGLEIGVLAWAFEALDRRAGDYEFLRIRGDEILIERRRNDSLERRTLNSNWTQLVLMDLGAGGKVKLALRSYGQETEFGSFLVDEERLKLARKLQAWLKPGR